PYPTLVALGAFAIMMAITRIVSLGSIVAAIVLPIAVGYFELRSEQFSKTIFVFTLVICLWVLVKHRTNIKRLQAGTEKPLESNGLDDRTTG
ncbi:glycerol-3-phosphate acyltransferase, partial [bacterium]|nr:glycerol-3-phosphate acyltransferase [bacterium]